MAAALLAGASAGGAVAPGPGQPMRCNGMVALCDRTLDEVVFAGTHNAMSSANLRWVFPNQRRWIHAQLAAGYRALLLDIHYWTGREPVRPYLERLPPAYRPVAVAALRRADPPRPGVFLCHGLCGLGATRLSEGLAVVNRYLDAHPHEVVILSIEDYVEPEHVRGAFHASGLLPRVYVPRSQDGAWPTLRELIERDQRVVVLADHRGGELPWYIPFRRAMQDTPLNGAGLQAFACTRNRGAADAPMLLVNHFLARLPPVPVEARLVNRYASIMAHVERCRRQRGMEPTVIAVDFFDTGDALRVVHDLNARRR
jgi:hypothetical protein